MIFINKDNHFVKNKERIRKMKKTKLKRVLAALIAVALTIGNVPFDTYAAAQTEVSVVQNATEGNKDVSNSDVKNEEKEEIGKESLENKEEADKESSENKEEADKESSENEGEADKESSEKKEEADKESPENKEEADKESSENKEEADKESSEDKEEADKESSENKEDKEFSGNEEETDEESLEDKEETDEENLEEVDKNTSDVQAEDNDEQIQVPMMFFRSVKSVRNNPKIEYEVRSDDYYKLVSKKDYELAPGITEAEIVLNNDAGSHRQVAHVVEVDLNNPYAKVIPSYKGMIPTEGEYGTQAMSQQAAWAEKNGYGNVVAAMNLSLSWYDSAYYVEHPEFVGEPLGYMVLDGVQYTNSQGQTSGAKTCVVINFDEKDGETRPADIPKVIIRSTSDPITGWEEQVIPANFGFLVKDGKNQHSKDHVSDPASRSFVGIKEDGTFVMVMNDGRQSPYSAGFNSYEMAEFMLSLGCVQVVNGDGGGSSTFLSQRPGEELKLNCSPSDGAERPTTHGILVISTAPATGEFVRANITAENDYYTPGSVIKFTALGTDLVGTKADIPSEAIWKLADETMGTIEDGVFVSNGKVGKVIAQLVYNDNIVGEGSAEIVIPTEFSFSQSVMIVPFDEEVSIDLSATINGGLHKVVLKPEDVIFDTTNPNLGTFDGFKFISVAASNAPDNLASTLTAILVYDETLVATASLSLGKGSEILFDFEKASDVDEWNIADVNGNDKGFYQKLSYATSVDGQVHDGIGSMRIEMNPIAANGISSGGYGQSDLFLDKGVVVENAKSIGFWAYIPDEYEHCWIRVLYWYDPDGDGKYDKKNTVTVINQPEIYNTCDESEWKYFSVDVSAYSKVLIPGLDCKEIIGYNAGKNDANNFRFIEFMFPHTNTNDLWKTYGTINGLQTVYIDNITADYSDAVEDREAPIFGNISLAGNDEAIILKKNSIEKVTSNVLTVSATVSENMAKTNATGINVASAKAYIDGVEVDTIYANGRITVSEVSVAKGVHRVKFEICDNAGNRSVVVRMVDVDAEVDASTIEFIPANSALDRLYGGSVYWMELNANRIETIDSIEAIIDLNYGNHWELDNMILADGFIAEYDVDKECNTATILIKRIGENEHKGSKTIASLPIRVIYYDADIKIEGYTAKTYWNEYDFWPYDLKVDVDMGKITYVENYISPVLNSFSNEEFSVDTEMYTSSTNMDTSFKQQRGTAHVHDEKNIPNKVANCIEDGYEGRTYCEICESVVKWGTRVDAIGHSYSVIDGELKCSCGELFSGIYTDGKMYVDGAIIADGWYENTYYYVNGEKIVGQYVVDGTMYTFDQNGIYQPDYSYTGFYNDGNGWMYFLGNFQKKGFVVIDDSTHYFDDKTGYAPIESFTLGEDRVYKVEGDKGKVLGAWDTFVVDGVERRRYYYSLRYYKNQWLEIEGEKYYFNNDGYALIGKRAVPRGGEYLGGYEFDSDGRLITAITGPFVDAESGYMYFAEDGKLACNKLVKFGDDYYFARNNHLLITWATEISESQANGLLPAGEYQFGADGKLIMQNGPIVDPYNSNYINFYKNGIRIYEEGLYEYKGDYYYVRPNGLLLTWGMNITKTNGLLPEGEYQFGADGKLQILNGPVADAYNSSYLNFYKNGIRVYEEGLYEYKGDYYYVRPNGLLLTWGMNITKTNGLLPEGEYQFGVDGKLQILNGPVIDAYNSSYMNFYKDGVRIYEEGLYEYKDNFYYVRANGLLITWGTYISEKHTNGLVPAGEYQFGADGKMHK